MREKSSLAVLVPGFALGCAPTLSSFTPAHVADKGHVQAEIGMDVSIPTGTMVRAIGASDELVKLAKERELTEAERQRALSAAFALLLNPPSVNPHIGVAYSVAQDFELNLRYSVGTLRLGGRYQILHQAKNDIDMTAGLGIGRYTYEFPVSNTLPFITIDDFERWQLDLPFLVGKHSEYFRMWAGPRLIGTMFDTAIRYHATPLPVPLAGPSQVLVSYEGYSFLAGAQGGVAAGYKKVFFAIELTLAEVWLRSKVLAHDGSGRKLPLNLASFIIYPGFALMGEF